MDKNTSKITHRMIERLTLIHKEIASGCFPSLKKLSKSSEVGTATISRDIQFLRERCAAPIKYNKEMNGYFYSNPNFVPSFILSDSLPTRKVPISPIFSKNDFADFMGVSLDVINALEELTDLGIAEQTELQGNLQFKYCGRTYLNGHMWAGLKFFPFSDTCKLSVGIWESYQGKKLRATHIFQSKHLSYFAESIPIDGGYWLYTPLDENLLKIKNDLSKKELLQFINFLQDNY